MNIKIAYITANFGLVSETFVTDLAEELRKSGQLIKIFCNFKVRSIRTSLEIEEVPFLILTSISDKINYRISKLLSRQEEPEHYQRLCRQTTKLLTLPLKEYQPDVAYVDFGNVAALACPVLEKLKIPLVVHFHGSDISSALNNIYYRQALLKVFKYASALIVASHHVYRLLVLEGAPREKIHLVRLGINLEELFPKSWDDRRVSSPSVVFLGRFTPKKSPVALLEAFALVRQEISGVQLSMIGDGPEMPRVKQRIKKLGLGDSVRLYGTLPRSEALPIVNQHWVFAQHSVTAPNGDQEGFGLSLAEAAALELPVVSTLHNGIPEQVIDGKTGFLVREFDYEAMAEHLVELLRNASLAETMGKRGRQHIISLCQSSARVDAINEIFLSVME